MTPTRATVPSVQGLDAMIPNDTSYVPLSRNKFKKRKGRRMIEKSKNTWQSARPEHKEIVRRFFRLCNGRLKADYLLARANTVLGLLAKGDTNALGWYMHPDRQAKRSGKRGGEVDGEIVRGGSVLDVQESGGKHEKGRVEQVGGSESDMAVELENDHDEKIAESIKKDQAGEGGGAVNAQQISLPLR